MLSFLRSLADLKPVVSSEQANDISQHGAVLNAVSEFSHTPLKPADMDDLFYNKGYEATSTGNLAAGISPLSTAIIRLIDDEDIYNIERIGHRRWFLDPSLYEVGLGFVENDDNYGFYSVIKVFNDLARTNVDHERTMWPGETAFPIEFIDNTIPWSLSLNPSLYDNEKVDNIQVTLSYDDQIHTLDSSDKDLEGEFFNVETSGYGVPYCIIFRPEPDAMIYQSDTVYWVRIEKIYLLTGDNVTWELTTKFFNLN
jgi:hypothetical protein